VKRIIGFLAGSKVYQKAQEDLLVQSLYQRKHEDWLKRLEAAESWKVKSFGGMR
jgi:hypothetical protein